MKIAITGASGKTGYRISEEAVKKGYKIRQIIKFIFLYSFCKEPTCEIHGLFCPSFYIFFNWGNILTFNDYSRKNCNTMIIGACNINLGNK